MNRIFIGIISALFVVVGLSAFGLHSAYPAFDLKALIGGDALMALLCLLVYFLVIRQLGGRPQAFVRGVMAATFIKLLVCMGALLAYALLNRSTIHKPTLYMLFGIYIVFTIVETWILSKMAKAV